MLRPQPGADIYQRLAPEREEDVPPETPWQAWTQGGLAFPPERWPWKAHDVTLVTLDVTQRQMDMMEAVVCQVACVA
jgi:hypothetical protein